jgi:Tol biopolymer transport system component
VSRFDERLTKELERAARPAEPADVFDEIDRRRERRVVVRRVQTALLATVVFAGSIGGVLVLNRAFRGDGATTPALPSAPARNGPIVVSFGDDGGTHMYLQDPDDPEWNPRDHQLTGGVPNWSGIVERDTNPAVSPDGRTVAFERTDVFLAATDTSVWTIGVDGTGLRQVSADLLGGQPAWSPDGTRIAYRGLSMDAYGILVVGADGSGNRMLTQDGGPLANATDPAWSPDGTKIAVAVPDGSDASSIASIDVETGESALISPAFWDAGSPSWSPDGQRLTFAHGGGIVLLTLADGSVTDLTTTHTAEEAASADLEYTDAEPTWSPDGQWIAFERAFSASETFVYAVRPDGTDLHRVGLGGDPAWGAMVPRSSESQPTNTPEPTESPTVDEPGRDIGLGYPVCNVETLHADLLGNGGIQTAWVATKRSDTDDCPGVDDAFNALAVDFDGDERADASYGPIDCQLDCRPAGTSDLDADGTPELFVTQVGGVTPSFRVYRLAPPDAIQPVIVVRPGDPAGGFEPARQASFSIGGDGFGAAWLACEDSVGGRTLISSVANSEPPDSVDSVWMVHETTLRLIQGGAFEVVDSRDHESVDYPFPDTPALPGGRIDLCGYKVG